MRNRISLPLLAMVLASSLATPQAATAQTVVLTCEQGNINSWKLCEVIPDTFSRYVWSATGVAVIDPYVCTQNSSACTAWCNHQQSPGGVKVELYNSLNQLVATRSRSIGCGGG